MASKRIIRIEVSGKDKERWYNLRPKLIATINAFLDTVIDTQNESTIRDEAKQFMTALLNNAKSKLEKAGIENQKIYAEIDSLYAQKCKDLAETRKLNAEAQGIEIQNKLRVMKFALSATKALIIGSENSEDILFIKEIDSLIEAIKSVENNQLDIS